MVRVEVIVLGGESIAHLIENDTVLKYQLPQISGGFTNSKPKEKKWTYSRIEESEDTWTAQADNILTKGYISIQAESHPIDFKNIKLLDLFGCKVP